jgi:hypothetical protein
MKEKRPGAYSGARESRKDCTKSRCIRFPEKTSPNIESRRLPEWANSAIARRPRQPITLFRPPFTGEAGDE